VRTYQCIQCQSTLHVTHVKSTCVVCASCKTLHVLEFGSLVKKEKEIVRKDLSPIKVGTSGVHDGKKFEVLGRYQFMFDTGLENNWYVLFEDGITLAWLSECSGVFAVLFPVPKIENLSKKIQVGKIIEHKSKDYQVCEIKRTTEVAMEGEIPSVIDEKISIADLMDKGNHLFSITYFNAGEYEVFEGRFTSFEELKLQNTSSIADEWK
jgi:hypothetical protein